MKSVRDSALICVQGALCRSEVKVKKGVIKKGKMQGLQKRRRDAKVKLSGVFLWLTLDEIDETKKCALWLSNGVRVDYKGEEEKIKAGKRRRWIERKQLAVRKGGDKERKKAGRDDEIRE